MNLQKSNDPTELSGPLSAAETKEFKTLKAQAIESFNTAHTHYQKSAEYLLVIKRRELWRAEGHKNWSAFLDHVAEQLDRTPRHLFEIIREAETRFKLLKSVQQKSPKLRKIVEKLKKEGVFELAKQSEDEQAAVLEIAVSQCSSGPPSAPTISAAAKAHAMKAKPGQSNVPKPKDNEGTEIENSAIWPMWERRDEVQPILTQLSAAKGTVKKALEAGDVLFAFIGNAVIADISKLYVSISNAKLHAVCTTCGGWPETQGKAGCGMCHGVGLISKTVYDRDSRSEVKEIRKRAAL